MVNKVNGDRKCFKYAGEEPPKNKGHRPLLALSAYSVL
uniref:Uncharacterized protein n=1 Tax=Rhizophora mucronata TaxID=61149 RepID=A0A2P2NBP8_RHIMU